MKGILVFYINYNPGLGQTFADMTTAMKEQNKELFHSIQTQSGYGILFQPCVNESCRIDKIEFESPWPRYVLPHVDVLQNEKAVAHFTQIASTLDEEGA